MNLALLESLGQELRFAKRINSNGATKLKLRANEVWIQICLNSNFKTFKNMFKWIIWIEGIIMKKRALVSLDLDKRAKSCDRLKNMGYSANNLFTNGSLAEIKRKRKILHTERSLPNSNERKCSLKLSKQRTFAT